MRINSLFDSYNEDNNPESQAHSAKYLAVLVSGYLEQAIKEVLLNYSSLGSRPQIAKYIESTWPISRNMSADNINNILSHFNTHWSEKFSDWLKDDIIRKSHINSIVQWRNSIAHGQESNTTGVTLVSVRDSFITIKELVKFIEETVKS
ncbi:hypothetical protein P20652_3358 [Pseudoalteromonas sp. BSi20652]|nr:hypothetical protein P20652_3358 [Pseudoalteromonas sp. BSi20652]